MNKLRCAIGVVLIAACLMFAGRPASAQVVTTLAGSGERSSADGDGVRTSFSGPSGLAVDSFGDLYVADSGNNRIRKIAQRAEKILPVLSGILDLSVGPDNITRLLRFDRGTGLMALDSLDVAGSISSGALFGPFDGWTARAAATGLDSMTRVLWTNEDGSAALWFTGAAGNQASFRLGPVDGATALDAAAAADGTTHVLWTYADGGMAVWSLDAGGQVSTVSVFGPFPGWTAAAIADGQDGLSRILWTKSDGSSGLWFLGPEGLAATARFGPVPGWSAADIAVGGDGLTRILWIHADGRMAVWTVDEEGTPRTVGPVYAPPWPFAAVRIAAGFDGATSVLWRSASDGELVWVLSAQNSFEQTFVLDPAPRSSVWEVTIAVTAVSGPTFCIWTPSVGMTFSTEYVLLRSGDSVSFNPPDPIDWDSFEARLNGSSFTASTGPIDSGGDYCAHFVQASTFSGSFSADGNHFTATETWSFALDSGEVKSVTFLWSGSRE